MRVFRNPFYVFLICLVSAGLAVAQDDSKKKEKSKDAPVERSVEVKANVKVLDAAGSYFNDLKLENLRVFEDGVEQKITYLARKEPVLNLGLVMDNTGSMRTQLETLVFTGGSLVNSLTEKDEALVVRFISSDKIEVIQDWTADKNKLRNAMESMFVEGGQSAMLDALYVSAEKVRAREESSKTKKYALVLVTDGEDRSSYYKLNEVLSRFKDSDLQIFVVGITNELSQKRVEYSKAKNPKQTAENLLRKLALETGGTAHLLTAEYKKEDLVKILNAIAEELRYPYVIGYTSSNSKRDGLARALRIEIANGEKGDKRQGYIRESFVVPKEESK